MKKSVKKPALKEFLTQQLNEQEQKAIKGGDGGTIGTVEVIVG